MSWVAVAIGGGAVLGAGASFLGANAQRGAANKASDTERQMFGQTQANLAPWLSTGMSANSMLVPGTQGFNNVTKPFTLADFQESPAYQFNLAEGQKAIDKHANAKGNLYAPQTLQDISKYSQGVASNEFQNAFSNYNTNQSNLFNRLHTLSSAGQNAAANLGGIGMQTAGQIGGNQIGGGNAVAGGLVGGANAISGAAGDYLNYDLMNKLISQQRPTYGV